MSENQSGDLQDPAEPKQVDVNIDTTPAGEDSAPEVETTDSTTVETGDVSVTETHTESPSEG